MKLINLAWKTCHDDGHDGCPDILDFLYINVARPMYSAGVLEVPSKIAIAK